MDNNTSNSQSNTGTSKPTFLSAENPDVLKNVDIKTTVSSGSINSTPQSISNEQENINSAGYSSPYSNQTQQPSSTGEFQPYSPPAQTNSQFGSPVMPAQQPFPQPSPFKQNYQLPTEDPLSSRNNVIYKSEENEGSSIIGRFLKQIISCLGCFLLIAAVSALAFVYFINL